MEQQLLEAVNAPATVKSGTDNFRSMNWAAKTPAVMALLSGKEIKFGLKLPNVSNPKLINYGWKDAQGQREKNLALNLTIDGVPYDIRFSGTVTKALKATNDIYGNFVAYVKADGLSFRSGIGNTGNPYFCLGLKSETSGTVVDDVLPAAATVTNVTVGESSDA